MGRGVILLTMSLMIVTWTQSQETSQGGGAQCSQLQEMMAEDLSLDQQTADLSRETADISKQTLEAVNKLGQGQGSVSASVCHARLVFSDHNTVGYDLSASSTHTSTRYQPASSLLNAISPGADSAWLKYASDNSPWIQVNMKVTNKVLGVITQARHESTQFVKTFFISYSSDYLNWTNYTLENVEDTVTKIFEGNKSNKDMKINMFQTPFTAKALRLHPVDCYVHCSLRWDVYSCTV